MPRPDWATLPLWLHSDVLSVHFLPIRKLFICQDPSLSVGTVIRTSFSRFDSDETKCVLSPWQACVPTCCQCCDFTTAPQWYTCAWWMQRWRLQVDNWHRSRIQESECSVLQTLGNGEEIWASFGAVLKLVPHSVVPGSTYGLDTSVSDAPFC